MSIAATLGPVFPSTPASTTPAPAVPLVAPTLDSAACAYIDAAALLR